MAVGFNQKVVGGINILAVLTLKQMKHQQEQYLLKTLILWKRFLATKTLVKLFGSQIKQKLRLLQICKNYLNLLAKAMWTTFTCHGGKNCTISIGSDKTVFTGWDSLQNRIISPMADTNTNGKITLEELYQYSYPLVLEAASRSNKEQHVSVYPENSQFVLFQK